MLRAWQALTKRLFTALAFALSVFNHTLRADEWYVSYEKGLDAVRKQQWEEALRHLNDAIADKPAPKANAKTYGLRFIDYFPYLYRGIAYYHLGNQAKALEDLGRSESVDQVHQASRDKNAERLLAEYLARTKKEKKEKPADTKFAEAVRLYNQKEYKKAIEQFQSVDKSSPQYPEAEKYIASAGLELKKAESAEASRTLKERVEKELNAGVQFFHERNLDKAEEQFKLVLQLDENRPEARRYLRKINTIRAEMAKPTSKDLVREPPHTASQTAAQQTRDSVFREGVAFFNSGKLHQAKAVLLSLRRLDPSYPQVTTYLGKVTQIEEKTSNGIAAFFEGQYQQSIELLAEASTNNTDNPHMYAFLACAYAAKYFLMGAEDKDLHQSALLAFSKVKTINAAYKLDTRYISPRIVNMFYIQ